MSSIKLNYPEPDKFVGAIDFEIVVFDNSSIV